MPAIEYKSMRYTQHIIEGTLPKINGSFPNHVHICISGHQNRWHVTKLKWREHRLWRSIWWEAPESRSHLPESSPIAAQRAFPFPIPKVWPFTLSNPLCCEEEADEPPDCVEGKLIWFFLMRRFDSSICLTYHLCSSWPDFFQYAQVGNSFLDYSPEGMKKNAYYPFVDLAWMTTGSCLSLDEPPNRRLRRLEYPFFCSSINVYVSASKDGVVYEVWTTSQLLGLETRDKGCIFRLKLVQQIENQSCILFINATVL